MQVSAGYGDSRKRVLIANSDGLLADDINVSVIQEQVEMGVAVRMAILEALAGHLPNG